MNRRNWIDLSRKLVDRYDLDYSFAAIQNFLGQQALAYFGEGVLPTKLFPVPFPIAIDIGDLNGTVGNGIGFDPNGQLTQILPGTSTSKTFAITPNASGNPRWDLLVLRYLSTGNTPVPKPSDPILTINLNLADDFVLAVIAGTPSGSPAYPAKGAGDIILCGFRAAAGATTGLGIVIDLGIRDIASALSTYQPGFVQETPVGVIDGSNTNFTLSQTPLNPNSLLMLIDGVFLKASDWTISGLVVTLSTPAPAPGQTVSAYYIFNNSQSVNPLSGYQETPAGTVDGTNATFSLAGKPANKPSTLVMIDGVIQSSNAWNLIQGASASQIVFTSGNIPATGQQPYTFYLVNAGSVGIGGMAVGGGALAISGSLISPNVITASSGITVSSSQRQLIYVASSGGSVTVTANPQIGPGIVNGQELEIIGSSNTNYPILSDGSGLSLNGSIILKSRSAIVLVWDGNEWTETSRR